MVPLLPLPPPPLHLRAALFGRAEGSVGTQLLHARSAKAMRDNTPTDMHRRPVSLVVIDPVDHHHHEALGVCIEMFLPHQELSGASIASLVPLLSDPVGDSTELGTRVNFALTLGV